MQARIPVAFTALLGCAGAASAQCDFGDLPISILETLPNQQHVAIGDVNGDGHGDLVVSTMSFGDSPASLVVRLGDGDGGFASGEALEFGHSGGGEIAIADFDGDGRGEIVIGRGGLDVYAYDDVAGVVFVDDFNGESSRPSVVDYNDDGLLDVIAASGPLGERITVYTNNGAGGFWSFSAREGKGASATAADVNGDGMMDLIGGTTFGGGVWNVIVYPATGVGTFAINPVTTALPGSHVWAIEAADLDGDGDTDLAVFMQGGNLSSGCDDAALLVLMNDGDATYTVSQNIPIGVCYEGMRMADLDLDGDADLALLVGEITTATGSLTIYDNDGGTMVPTLTPSVGERPSGLGAGDLNGDGAMELAVSHARLGAIVPGATSPTYVYANGCADFPPSLACLCDFDGGGGVNFNDLNVLLSQFGLVGPGLIADVNEDGTVDFTDLNAVLSTFGEPCDD